MTAVSAERGLEFLLQQAPPEMHGKSLILSCGLAWQRLTVEQPADF